MINIFHKSLTLLIRGAFKDQWVDHEYRYVKNIVNNSEGTTILQKYNEVFNVQLVIADTHVSDTDVEKEDDCTKTRENLKSTEVIEIEMEEFNKVKEEKKTTTSKKSPTKTMNKNKCSDCSKNNEKMINMERVINEMDKELNYWVTTYKENKQQSDLQIKAIMEEIIKPLTNDNKILMDRLVELENKLDVHEQVARDRRVQLKNEIKNSKLEVKSEIREFEIDVQKIKHENENISKEQLKLHQKVHEIKIVNKRKEEDKGNKVEKNDLQRPNVNDKDKLPNTKAKAGENEIKVTNVKPRETIITKRLTVLMDSNRKFIEFSNLLKDKEVVVIPCGSVDTANNILRSKNIKSDEILLHIGVNDVEVKEPNVVFKEMANLARRLLENNCRKLYLSMVTTRKDHLSKSVGMVNTLIRQELSAEIQNQLIVIIDHPNITSHKLHDKKHLSKNWTGDEISGVEELCVDFVRCINGSENSIELVKSIRRPRNQPYRYQGLRNNNFRKPLYTKYGYKEYNDRYNHRNQTDNQQSRNRYFGNNEKNNANDKDNNNYYRTLETTKKRYVNYTSSCNSNFSTLV